LLPNLIGPAPEQDLQRLADELGRCPLEQSGTNGLRGHDETGLINHHDDPTQFELGRGVAGRWAGTSGAGLWIRKGQHGAAGTLILAWGVHNVAT
jgi:hypothetical protein